MDLPFQIALTLADFVRTREASFHFNHQIAWSRIELTALLHNNGFAVELYGLGFHFETLLNGSSD